MNKPIKLFPSIWSILPDELLKLENTYSTFSKDFIKGVERDSKLVLGNLDLSQTGLSQNVRIINNIGILNIEGVIQQKSDFFTMLFGGATLDTLTNDLKMLVGNDQIETIVLDIDSPGGTVSGVQEFANLVFEARQEKTIFAISSSIMTSAAMWIGAAAHSVFISDDTVMTGSIGVLITHFDISGLEEMMGVKTTEITAGKFKRIASSHEALTDEGREELQSQVDHIMNVFTGDIATFRGVSQTKVNNKMADGKVFIGDNAIKAGLIDDIINFDLLIETISNGGLNMFGKSTLEATMANLEAEYPELYKAAVAIGVDKERKFVTGSMAEAENKARGEGSELGKVEGASLERGRIQGINDCVIAGHEDLAKEMIADGKTTPGEAAIRMINANKQQNKNGLKAIKDQSSNAIESEAETTIISSKEMTAKEEWDSKPELAKEFSSFEAFEAMKKNYDNFKILKK